LVICYAAYQDANRNLVLREMVLDLSQTWKLLECGNWLYETVERKEVMILKFYSEFTMMSLAEQKMCKEESFFRAEESLVFVFAF
jgi:1,2-phenylacetyl-CoA epoxidase catalytic subunit